jgi:hypothetical protein
MKLGNRQFFNLFARLIAATNPDRDCEEWEVEGVHWRRERHIHWAVTSYQMEVHRLFRKTGPAWTLLFVHETWWSANRKKSIRDACWTHLETGTRRDVIRWFDERERELDS